jgi:hypothetical protein
LLLAAAAGLLPAQSSYKEEMEKWRKLRAANLVKDDGWTTVVGLFWLKEGDNTVGADPKSRIALPEGAAPAHVGKFVFRKGKTTFIAEPGANATSNGKPVRTLDMQPDTEGPATIVFVNDLSMFVIGRGDRYAIRLRDKNSRFRKEFHGLTWFPVDEAWRIKAKWTPYTAARKMAVESVTGETSQEPSPGYAAFKIGATEYRLEPVLEGERLFFIFKDRTAGKETYAAGRFLYTAMPRDGYVTLDFNMAFTPPCAFSPFLTCPLPPPQNRLPDRIPAGEMDYKH